MTGRAAMSVPSVRRGRRAWKEPMLAQEFDHHAIEEPWLLHLASMARAG
jgi:hypothetical protein